VEIRSLAHIGNTELVWEVHHGDQIEHVNTFTPLELKLDNTTSILTGRILIELPRDPPLHINACIEGKIIGTFMFIIWYFYVELYLIRTISWTRSFSQLCDLH
jgi:hypothetical protein